MTDLLRTDALPAFLRNANTVDLILLLALLLYALDGVRRGFIAGMLNLAGIVATVAVALKGYRFASDLIRTYTSLPPLVANIAGFFAVLLLAQVVVTILVRIILAALKPVRRLFGPLRAVDHLLGAVPGLAQGLIIAALILTPLHLFPISPSVASTVDESAMAKEITQQSSKLAPQLEAMLGQVVEDGMLFQSRIVGQNEQVRIAPQHNLVVDPASEREMLVLVNQERVKYGLKPLVPDDALRAVARAHSTEMLELGYFAHESPVYGSPQDRVKRGGIVFGFAGENLAYAPAVEVAHSGLMNSPGHRKNILDPQYSRIGIGVVSAGLAGKMFTQNFTG